MKKIILLILFVNAGFAQLSNGNFESIYTNTTTTKTFFNSWNGVVYGSDTSSVSKSGNYAAKVWTWYYYSPGYMSYGASLNSLDKLMGGGLPISAKPIAINGFYKFDSVNVMTKDSAFIFLALKKWNITTNKRDTIAFCWKKLPTANVYTPFSFIIPYINSTLQPDSMVLIFATDDSYLSSSGNSVKNACNNSSNGNCAYFYIDDLTLSGPAGLTDIYGNKLATGVYPNPASGEIKIKFNKFISLTDEPIFILYNVAGQKIFETKEIDGHELKLDTKVLRDGVYFYSLRLKTETFSGRFVVSHEE
jgi:hypothetical protein